MRGRHMTAAVGTLKRLFLVVGVAWVTPVQPTSAQTFEIIKSFEDARGPFAALVQGTDGAFYGTTEFGGTFGYGTVFRVALDGSSWRRSVVHSFNGPDGSRPWSGLLLGTDGALYGTTTSSVYRLVGSGESWALEVLFEFDGATGSGSIAGLTWGTDGALYGTTTAGGAGGQGTVFRLSPLGPSWTPEVLHAFAGADGASPYGRVIFGADGALYGTTYSGGASNQGTIFRLSHSGGWVHQVLRSFSGADGANPWAGLTLGSDGALYGTTESGGSGGPSGAVGTVFRISGSGSTWTHTVLVNFDWSNGAIPRGELIEFGGAFYGTTVTISLGYGTVFRLTGSGTAWTHEIVHALTLDPDATDADQGSAYPQAGVILGQDGALYGTSHQGGPGIFGTVFRLAGGAYERIAHFGGAEGRGSTKGLVVGTDGALYGTTQRGGARYGGDGWGNIFRLSRAAGQWTHDILYDFGPGGFEGGGVLAPSGVSMGAAGTLYGTHLGGGPANCGTIFSLSKSGETWTREALHLLGCIPGPATPLGGVTAGADGALYGTTWEGGTHGLGTIFRLVPSGSGWTFETLHDFDVSDGVSPQTAVVFGSDGALYGTTPNGGAFSGGTAFRLAPNGADWTFQVIHDFAATTGAGAYGRLALGPDGALYGTTYFGGHAGSAGTVYRLAWNGAAWTHEVLTAFGDDVAAGAHLLGGLAIGNDGVLYGTAVQGGGPANAGTVFRVRREGSTWVRDVLHTCMRSDCATPSGDLLISGRSLYGTAEGGGPEGGGIVFRVPIVPPTPQLSAALLAFGGLNLGLTSSPQTIIVTNVGGGHLAVTDATVTGDFAITNGCSLRLDEDESCTIDVTFTPTATGPRTGTLTITTDAGGPLVVDLSGTGTIPVASLSPPSLDFASAVIGSTVGPQIATLQNTGTGPLTITHIQASGEFAVATTTCPTAPATLNAGSSCTIDVTFTPTAEGPRTGTLTLSHDAPGGPSTVALTGDGQPVVAPPVAEVTPGELAFGGANVGSTSTPQVVTVRNAGGATLHVTSVVVVGDFAVANGCTAPLIGGASCTIEVAFQPTARGALTGTLTVMTDAGGPFAVSLSGTGTAPRVKLRLTSSKSWVAIVGLTRSAFVTLTNQGDGPLTISSISVSGDYYSPGDSCPAPPAMLAPQADCVIVIWFTPTATGSRSGQLTVISDATNSPTTMALSATGVLPLGVFPIAVTFADQEVGAASAPQVVNFWNSSPTHPIDIASMTITGDFLQTNDCGPTIPPGGSCQLSVSFRPSKKGNLKGTITVTSSATTSPNEVSLSGKGI